MVNPRIFRILPYVACVLSITILSFYLYTQNVRLPQYTSVSDWWKGETVPDLLKESIPIPTPKEDRHPIIELLRRAEEVFDNVLAKETRTLGDAVREYRARRGRQPPPGFDKWWEYAQANKAIIVEDFWDQIYHDLNPLWALDPKDMLRDVRSQNRQMKIRNAVVSTEADHFWMPIWQELIQSVAKDLPDMDMSMNSMDEPRMWVPWEKMTKYMEIEGQQRRVASPAEITDQYSEFQELNVNETLPEFPWDSSGNIWPRVVVPCPPDSPARTYPIQTDYTQPPNLTLVHTAPHTHQGYVSNNTLSMSLCHQPDLQGLHGFFIEPISTASTDKLFPLFGSSKLAEGSEILIPPTMYYKGDERFTNTDAPVPWDKKTDTIVWRGLASGGRNKAENWKGFHRHRLVSMLNGTQALLMPNSSDFIDIASLPLEIYNLQTWKSSKPKAQAMGEWLTSFTDAAFNDLACFPKREIHPRDLQLDRRDPDPRVFGCDYTDYLFEPKLSINLLGQHGHKYLPDVDGNSFSGRYRDFLSSFSVPIKATVFKEWHDSRIWAWKHFVPSDNRFMDIYGIMEFFLGTDVNGEPDEEGIIDTEGDTADGRAPHPNKKRKGGRDQLAKKIGTAGREWSQKVLRPEDMRIYMYRLLLEYARVMDEKRDVLGWIDKSDMEKDVVG